MPLLEMVFSAIVALIAVSVPVLRIPPALLPELPAMVALVTVAVPALESPPPEPPA